MQEPSIFGPEIHNPQVQIKPNQSLSIMNHNELDPMTSNDGNDVSDNGVPDQNNQDITL